MIPVEGTLKMVSGYLFSIDCKTPWFATDVTLLDIVTYFLDIVL